MPKEAEGEAETEGSAETGSNVGPKLKEGDAVEARHGGQAQWFSGKISSARDDGTFDVTYDDGDKEKKVGRYRIRRKGEKPRRALSEGEEVDVRHGGGKKLFPGKITKVHEDGTYDIAYLDGDKETRVARKLIEAACGGGG